MGEPMIECENLVKIYKTSDTEVLALQGLELTVEKGELMAIIGNSGSGKSTFLNMIGGLDRPSAGRLIVDGLDLFKLSDEELVAYKRDVVGFVWQNNARNLVPYLSALENVQVPMMFQRGKGASKEEGEREPLSPKDRETRAKELLELVGMSHRAKSRLSQLSGGEQQRVAIAIALANNPKLLLADEPTGSVDLKTSEYILDVFRKLNEELGLTIVIVTHDRNLSKKVNRVVAIRDGKTSSEMIMRQSYKEQMAALGSLEDAQEGDNGAVELLQEEYAVLDRAGRLQIPAQMLEEIGVSGKRVHLEVKDGRIVIEGEKPDA